MIQACFNKYIPMKLVYKTPDGYKAYSHKIAGYMCRIFVLPDGRAQVGMPFGNTKEEKVMFDNLVYYNKSVYNGKTISDAVDKVRNFIRSWKKEHVGNIQKHT